MLRKGKRKKRSIVGSSFAWIFPILESADLKPRDVGGEKEGEVDEKLDSPYVGRQRKEQGKKKEKRLKRMGRFTPLFTTAQKRKKKRRGGANDPGPGNAAGNEAGEKEQKKKGKGAPNAF